MGGPVGDVPGLGLPGRRRPSGAVLPVVAVRVVERTSLDHAGRHRVYADRASPVAIADRASPVAIADMRSANTLSRSAAACQYICDAVAVRCRSRCISSAGEAPAAAANTPPVCLRSCHLRSGRPICRRALSNECQCDDASR